MVGGKKGFASSPLLYYFLGRWTNKGEEEEVLYCHCDVIITIREEVVSGNHIGVVWEIQFCIFWNAHHSCMIFMQQLMKSMLHIFGRMKYCRRMFFCSYDVLLLIFTAHPHSSSSHTFDSKSCKLRRRLRFKAYVRMKKKAKYCLTFNDVLESQQWWLLMTADQGWNLSKLIGLYYEKKTSQDLFLQKDFNWRHGYYINNDTIKSRSSHSWQNFWEAEGVPSSMQFRLIK